MKIKKTKIFILSSLSVFGLSLMVGSTFAQWAVTDNADPFSITVSLDNMPVEQGYYLTFASDNYSPIASSAVKMTSDNENKAKAENITILDDSKVKIYYFDGLTYESEKVDLSYNLGTEHGFASISGSEVTFNTDRSGSVFSLYLNNNDELYIADETFKSYSGYYITYADDNYAFRSENLMNDTPSSGNDAQESVSIAANKSFRIEHFEGLRGIISTPNLQAANYPHFTTSGADSSTITIKEAATYKLMVSSVDHKVYIANDALSGQNGYYLTYSDSNFDYRSGVKMGNGSGTNLAELSIDLAANKTVKIISVDAVNDTVSSTKYLQGDSGKSYLSTQVNSETLTFNKADTYDIYLGADGKVYTAIGSYNTIYLKTSNEWNQTITNSKMIYFVNNRGWSNVKVYVFKAGGSGKDSWPGVDASYVENNEYGQGIYSVEVDTSTYDSVIFNNGTGEQTVDISITGYQDSTQLYPNGEWQDGKAKVSSYTGYRPVRTGPHFYAWVWETDQAGRWVALNASTTHSGYYEMTIHSYETNLIFARCAYVPTSTDGSELNDYHVWNKTGDLTISGNKNCYTISGWSSGSWSTLS